MTRDTLVFLTTASVTLPIERHSNPIEANHLAGLGLLVARREAERWSFEIDAIAATCETGETPLLKWGLSVLPEDGQIIGWRLAKDVVPPLLSAAKDAEPELAWAFLQRLFALLIDPPDDLALDHGGAAAPALPEQLQAAGLVAEPLSDAAALHAWTNRRTAPVLASLKEQVLGLAQLWLMRESERDHLRVAVGRWLAEQRAAGALG